MTEKLPPVSRSNSSPDLINEYQTRTPEEERDNDIISSIISSTIPQKKTWTQSAKDLANWIYSFFPTLTTKTDEGTKLLESSVKFEVVDLDNNEEI